MRRTQHVALTLLAAGLVTALAACGTTVTTAGSLPGTGLTDGSGLQAPGTPGGPGATPDAPLTPGAPGASLGPVPGGQPGPGGGSTPGVTRSGNAPGLVDATRGADGIGVTATKVFVGFTVTTNSEAANSALGVDSFAVGDVRSYIEAVLAHVNRTGGVKGRTLTPVYAPDDATSAEDGDARAQARCATFTQDNKVFAVLDSSPRDSFLQCVQKTAINIGGFEVAGFNETDFQRYRHFYDVNTLTGEKQYAGLVASLVRQDYFGGWNTAAGTSAPAVRPVVGVVSVDYPQIVAVTDKVLLPALARAGHAVDPDNVVRLFNGRSTADSSRTITEIQSAVLRFRTNGVTHAIVMDNAGGVTLFFSQGAENQGYRPRYGITSANAVQALVEAGQMAAEQAAGAMGLGYVPLTDLPASANPDNGRYSNATRRACLAIYAKAQVTFADNNAKAIALGFCDKILFFAQTARAVPGALNRETFQDAVEGLGSSFVASPLEVSRFDAAHHYGIVRGYDLRFDSSCRCQRYGGAFSLD